ncbi:IS66 family insertion sequence element accessory protein TnpA [Metallibacterium scheffleri]|uniref:IS66 family insertion sequence element accessory protein TnpA n=1 Tax=Metallibacterium scheffleri TaxID=993689 RepID=UPI0023F2D276|nr:hypothetical protein [Metallibacterium scheffleri]
MTVWLLHARAWFSDAGVVMTSGVQKRVLWQQRLADLEASGMTRTAYCAARGIGYSTLQRWQRRLRREAATGAVVQADDAPGAGLGLIPIRVRDVTAPKKEPAAAPPDLALTWPSGLRLQLPVATDARWLVDLLRSLGC